MRVLLNFPSLLRLPLGTTARRYLMNRGFAASPGESLRTLAKSLGYLQSNKEEDLQLLPLLQANVSRDWLSANVQDVEHRSVELKPAHNFWASLEAGLSDILKNAEKLPLPVGFAEIRTLPSPALAPPELLLHKEVEDAVGPKSLGKPSETILARSWRLHRASEATQFLHHWARQRAAWWRKLSSCPGSFTLEETTLDHLTVKASLPNLEPITVETIGLADEPFIGMLTNLLSQQDHQVSPPAVVESSLLLDTAALVFLADSVRYQEQDGSRLLALHRRLTPYKCAFAVSQDSSEELRELAGFLSRCIERVGLSVWPPSHLQQGSMGSTPLHAQIQRSDELGVPFCAMLEESALKDGVLGLRSRDTTLAEQVHVANLKKYIRILVKNY